MKNNKGITLIALVITIIVLLILAGVSIAMLTGENGILSNATKAQEDTTRENAIERINLALQAIKTETLAQQNDNTTFDPITVSANLDTLTNANITGIGTDESVVKKTSGSESATDGKFFIEATQTAAVEEPATPATAKITISYAEAKSGVDVEGSITFSATNRSGLISEAAQ